MGILATLKKEVPGEWLSLADFLREARLRETGALGALAAALAAPPDEQKELAAGEGAAVLLELARDLRVPKGARLASTRCLLEAGAPAEALGQLFAGAGDLVTDPRLGSAARKLVESGLPAALQAGGEIAKVSLAAAAFARAVHSASSAVGAPRTKELLASAPQGHAGAEAALFALGQGELPEKDAWRKLLDDTCAANRKAPAAAKRMGLAPQWPPNAPDAFAPLVKAAEEASSGVQSKDAVTNPLAVAKPAQPVKPPPPAAAKPAPPPLPEMPAGKQIAPPIRRSPFKRPIGTVIEGPTRLPPKAMDTIEGRKTANQPPPPDRPRVEVPEEPAVQKPSPLPGMTPLLNREEEAIRFDPSGKRIPRPDRWRDDAFEWERPTLPSSDLPPPMKARPAQGPFTTRLSSIFQDRPEAVDRLCAAAEARVAVAGEEAALAELTKELGQPRWKDSRLPSEQKGRLRNLEADASVPASWRSVARLLLDRLGG